METVQLPPVEIDGNVTLKVSEELDEGPENTLDQDENVELMAEERTIAPIQFSGSAENWLRHFNNYCTYKAVFDYGQPSLVRKYPLSVQQIFVCILTG